LEQFKPVAGHAAAYRYAEIYAPWGNMVAALHWLTQAEELHDALLVQLRVDPFLQPIRKEPQFKAIEGRLNIPS
jgi:hypothetical protein